MSLRRTFLSSRSSSSSSHFSSNPTRRIQPHQNEDDDAASERSEDQWSRMLPDLLTDIIRRVDSSEDLWPTRKDVVSCACVCRRWREVTSAVVGSTRDTGKITFPKSLKEPGPKELPMQCFIKRNKKNSTFHLYLSLAQTFMDKGKFLLAARRFRHGAHTEYIISLDPDDLSQGSNAYVGKLRSDLLGTKYTIYDGHTPCGGAKAAPRRRMSRRFTNKQISPQVAAAGSFEIGHVSYKFNLFKSRGPRRMLCRVQYPSAEGSFVLKNKAPRWHDHLQCWCLNFHGRVTVASVKNFQLVGDDETVLLQFGKVGDDTFTMDYRQPLSAFQAFAISLSCFGTKFACE